METLERAALRVGRVLLALIFVLSALGKLVDWYGTEAFMSAKGMFAVPFFLVIAVVIEFVGGLAVMTGVGARVGALALLVFLVPATLIFHDFWTLSGQERQEQRINFMKNLSIMGGLIMVSFAEKEHR